MNLLHLLAVFPQLAREFVGRRVERVLPVERRGVHLILERSRRGLRLDRTPGKGIALACSTAPRRLRGGRSAWPDFAARLDRDWRDKVLEALRIHPGIPALRAESACGGSLTLLSLRSGAVLLASSADGTCHSLPRDRAREAERALETVGGFLSDLDALGAALERWAAMREGISREESIINLGAILPSLPRRDVQQLFLAEDADIKGFADALRGGELPERSRRGVLPELWEGLESSDLMEAGEAWYLSAIDAARLDGRRQGLARIVRGETKRRARAVAAIARESERAEDPQVVRRRADALMAVGSRLPRGPDGFWEIPDPWNPGETQRIAVDPPGATSHEVAGKLYSRARKEERGSKIREARDKELRGELKRLERLAEALRTLPEAGEILEVGLAEIESGLEVLGIAARPEHREVSAAPKSHARSADKAARVFHSPSGFVVLVGRSSRQNDRLTFKVAGPEDLWFHVMGQPGAHVVLRVGDRHELPEEDLLFAARLAAAWSRVCVGERVDVHMARRKHVRKPRGAPAGAVTVRKSKTLQVVVPPRPDRPGI